MLCANATARRRRLRAGAADHSLSSALVASATVIMHQLRHNRNATSQIAPDTIVVAVNPIIPPALRPPSARALVLVVAQTRDIRPDVIRMIVQERHGIVAPPRATQSHRVIHRGGVDCHTLDSTRIPHCPLFSDIMQGSCQAQSGAVLCFTCIYFSLFSPFQSPLRPCIFALYQVLQKHKADVLSRMIRMCVYVIISLLRSAR